ncbi:diguanylate cyclase domain-containing protein [Dactylosporangium sp. CS-033363]|uniref:diguanylate cyclase domain-containing protein n=1 Tax=Dactylosporangium sp. CS-033363 TaxID=3239935 RepID=UPI003D8E1622
MKTNRLLAVYSPLFAIAAGWALVRLAGFDAPLFLGWLPGAIGIAIGGVYLLVAAETPGLGPAGRRFWRHLAIASLLIAPSTGPFTEASLGGRRSGPLLYAAVGLLAVALLLVLWALLRLPTRVRGRGDWLRLGLDAFTVLVCSATFLWHFVVRPIADAPLPEVLGLLVLCLLCLLAVLAVVKLILAGTAAVDGAALRALALVVLIGSVGSALVPVLPSPRLAGLSDLVTMCEALMVAVAGILQARRAGRAQAVTVDRRRPYSVLPYLAVAAVNLLLVAVAVNGTGSLPVLVGAVVATGAVVARQLLAFRDNDGLLRSLREHQRLLHEQATHDALTGLPNRALFNERLEHATAAILVDLDDFKAVNDTLGHPVGDGLLIEVGRRLRAAVRPSDLVARLGGDEFAVLVLDADTVDDPADAELDAVAERILAELAPPVHTHGHVLTVTASVGVAARDGDDGAQDLLRHADIAMYAAKRRGKGTHARYTPDLSGLLMTPQSRLADLRRAIAEARPPFTLEVGRAALVSPGFAAELGALLAEAGLRPEGLTLALPAAQLAGDGAVGRAMGELRSAGFGLALDQTGTGTVRMDLLSALPFTALIVDPAFLGIEGTRSVAFTEAVAAFVREAGIDYRVRSEGSLLESAL